MKTFIFTHKHTNAELILNAEKYEDAFQVLKNLVINTEFWIVDNKDGEKRRIT